MHCTPSRYPASTVVALVALSTVSMVFAASPEGPTDPAEAQAGADPAEALLVAASRGEVESVRAILEAGAVDVDAANEYGATALILACNSGRADVVRVLLEAGADANLADTFYARTPLAWAAVAGSEEVVSLLFQNGAEGFDVLFHNAVTAGDLERVGYLAGLNTPPDEVLSAALQVATEARNVEMVGLLERLGAQPPPPEVFDIEAALLSRYEGLYLDEVGYQLEVRADLEAKVLLVKPLGMRNSLRFFPTDETTFIAEEASNIFVRFVVREGRVASMTFSQAGSTRRLMKQ